MSMDALTATAFSALAKRDLPALHGKLVALAKLPPQKRAKDPDLATLIDSAMASLRALSMWAKDENPSAPTVKIPSEPATPELPSRVEVPTTVPQDMARDIRTQSEQQLNELFSLVGDLIIDRTKFTAIAEDIDSSELKSRLGSKMSETIKVFGRHINAISDTVAKIRMVPLSKTLSTLPQLVNEQSHKLGKELLLELDLDLIEIDTAIAEAIADPIHQIIRNACEHGIESKAERLALAKPVTGRISIKAKVEGNLVVLKVSDDGRGLNVESLRRKALDRGLITSDDLLSKKDLFNVIFERGFSTASLVTELSGRGVGLDFMRRQVAKLNGMIELESEVAKGLTVSIRIPRTSSVFNGIIIESQNQTFALPLTTVIESKRIAPEDIQGSGDQDFIKWQDRLIPLLHLHKFLGLERREKISWYSQGSDGESQDQLQTIRLARRQDRFYVLIIGSGEKRFGLVCDKVLNQQELVVKALGPMLQNVPYVAGGAVLARGDVVLVLDIPEVAGAFLSTPKRMSA